MENQEYTPAAFVVITTKEGYTIGLAHKGVKGYTPGYGSFDNNKTYDQAARHVDELNENHYGHTKLEAARIVNSSMFL